MTISEIVQKIFDTFKVVNMAIMQFGVTNLRFHIECIEDIGDTNERKVSSFLLHIHKAQRMEYREEIDFAGYTRISFDFICKEYKD